VSPPPGCAFHPRCPFATEQCRRDLPPLETGRDGHAVACWVFPAE
jgi:peptide/nickel transport system ATP-binding protein